MIERSMFDLRNGVFYNFLLLHPKGPQPRLMIQPPEGYVGKQAPEFDANALQLWLCDEVRGQA